jgi:hypothetical protein
MRKTLAAFGLIVLIFFVGCEKEPSTSVAINPDTNALFNVYIHVSAEDSSSQMPFSGECDLWVSDVPIANPPPRDPDAFVTWYSGQYYPVTVHWQHQHDDPKYLIWVGWQNVSPPNPKWQTQTMVYNGYVEANEDYNGYCVFYLN